jgi:hypothetical protein
MWKQAIAAMMAKQLQNAPQGQAAPQQPQAGMTAPPQQGGFIPTAQQGVNASGLAAMLRRKDIAPGALPGQQ